MEAVGRPLAFRTPLNISSKYQHKCASDKQVSSFCADLQDLDASSSAYF
jgi:hypothetical protein